MWCCVLNRKKSRVWKPRSGSRDGLGYCHSEGPTVEFCAAFPCNSALNNCSFWSPKRTDSCQGHHKCPSDLYGKATDRTLGNFCVQGATGKRGVAVPAGLMDRGHQEEEGCFHTRGTRRNVCETWVQVGTSWTCPDLTVWIDMCSHPAWGGFDYQVFRPPMSKGLGHTTR